MKTKIIEALSNAKNKVSGVLERAKEKVVSIKTTNKEFVKNLIKKSRRLGKKKANDVVKRLKKNSKVMFAVKMLTAFVVFNVSAIYLVFGISLILGKIIAVIWRKLQKNRR